ncbi:MAG: phage tail tape measure protein, partial [Gammaproteobacteria bacterium]|nr:phage tail tape measure protein [Gammaproteobacteria bacterium]
ALNQQFQSAIAPGIAFQDGLADVEAITGVTGDALTSLGLKARASAKDFGGSAADSLNSYKVILSRLGPDIANNQEALDGMERNVRTLSKTMGGDATASVDALTTAMLQYRVDLSDPAAATQQMTDMMNVMAAGAKFGSAEVTDVAAGLKVAGVQAKIANLSFEEVNSALQELARGGKSGAEAGTSLRNVLGKMAGEDIIPKEAADKLRELGVDMAIVSDTTLPFTDRLRELRKAQGDATIMAKVFGVENAAAANILLNSIDAQEDLTRKIHDTNTATEQASVKMATYSERMSRFKARLDDVGIGLFNMTKSFAPAITVAAQLGTTYLNLRTVFGGLTLASVRQSLANVWNAVTSGLAAKAATNLRNRLLGVVGAAGAAGTGMGLMGVMSGAASLGLGALTLGVKAASAAILSIPIIGWIIALVGAIIALFTYLWANVDGFSAFFYGLGAVVKEVFGDMVNAVQWAWNAIGEWIGAKVASISELFKRLANAAAWVWNMIKEKAVAAFGSLYTKVASVFGRIRDTITNAFGKARALVQPIIDKIGGYLDKVMEKIAPLIEYMKKLGTVFRTGRDKRLADLDQKRKKESAESDPMGVEGLKDPLSDVSGGNGDKGAKDSLTGSGSGGGKSITMTLDIKNYFNVASGVDVQALADQIVRKVNDRLRDAVVAVG